MTAISRKRGGKNVIFEIALTTLIIFNVFIGIMVRYRISKDDNVKKSDSDPFSRRIKKMSDKSIEELGKTLQGLSHNAHSESYKETINNRLSVLYDEIFFRGIDSLEESEIQEELADEK